MLKKNFLKLFVALTLVGSAEAAVSVVNQDLSFTLPFTGNPNVYYAEFINSNNTQNNFTMYVPGRGQTHTQNNRIATGYTSINIRDYKDGKLLFKCALPKTTTGNTLYVNVHAHQCNVLLG